MRKIDFCLMMGAGLLGFHTASVATSGNNASPTSAEVAAVYTGYQRLTKDPVFVNRELAMLCRGATQQDVESARVKYGPHANAQVIIYMNDLAANAYRDKAAAYPAGSVVVKEKKMGSHHDEMGQWVSDGSDGVGGMIKRAAGYDPEHGDWEYFYFDQPPTVQTNSVAMPLNIESGKIASCVQCHAAAQGTDHVFGAWGQPSNPPTVPAQTQHR